MHVQKWAEVGVSVVQRSGDLGGAAPSSGFNRHALLARTTMSIAHGTFSYLKSFRTAARTALEPQSTVRNSWDREVIHTEGAPATCADSVRLMDVRSN